MEIITGYTGAAHITAEQDRDINKGIFGEGSYVLETGSQLEAELVSNNEIKIRDGVLVHQGCAAAIKKNTYDSLTITNGSQSMKRIDLIVARYTRNSGTKEESVELKLLRGTPTYYTPSVPSYTTGDIQAGDLVADMPLYKITLNGLNVTSVEKMFTTFDGLASLNANANTYEAGNGGDITTPTSGVNMDYVYFKRFGKIVTVFFRCGIGSFPGQWSNKRIATINDEKWLPRVEGINFPVINQNGIGFDVSLGTDGVFTFNQRGVSTSSSTDTWLSGNFVYICK